MQLPNPESAVADLDYIRDVIARTERRVDPHAFHSVHWGAIVLIWYPLANLFVQLGHPWWQLPLGIGAVLLGAALSAVREIRLSRNPRLPGEDTFLTRQITVGVYALVAAGIVLSAAAPASGFIEGRNVPVIWGLIYAVMAFQIGILYKREFVYAGGVIFTGAVMAMILHQYNGYILGPFMGLGMIVPGLIAERRVRRMLEEDIVRAAGQV